MDNQCGSINQLFDINWLYPTPAPPKLKTTFLNGAGLPLKPSGEDYFDAFDYNENEYDFYYRQMRLVLGWICRRNLHVG